jgi:hypothetical protein
MCAEVREMVEFIDASKRGICVGHSTAVRRLPEHAKQGKE